MAYDTRGTTRRSRNAARDRQERARRRIRGLSNDIHTDRWCPTREVSVLVGPTFTCPACGEMTTLS
ncbi:MAG: hypothetical protein HKM97_08885 [Acidimicrobiia bacterium]|nr:hypothetical protein [Acidimicrobiia bacterium]